MAGSVVGLLLVAAAVHYAVLTGTESRGELGYDAALYIDSARRWFETGKFYYPVQFAGSYPAEGTVMLYPPLALYLFAPFIFLPRILWWIVPLAVIAMALRRGSAWRWTVVAGILAMPPVAIGLAYGNTDLWMAAIIATIPRRPAVAPLVAMKPTFAPLGLLFVWRRKWWIGAAALVLLSLPFGDLWLDWVLAMQNVEGSPLRSVGALVWAVPLLFVIDRPPVRWPLQGRRITSAPRDHVGPPGA